MVCNTAACVSMCMSHVTRRHAANSATKPKQVMSGTSTVTGTLVDEQVQVPVAVVPALGPTFASTLLEQLPDAAKLVSDGVAQLVISKKNVWAAVRLEKAVPITCPVQGHLCAAVAHCCDGKISWFAVNSLVSAPTGRGHTRTSVQLAGIVLAGSDSIDCNTEVTAICMKLDGTLDVRAVRVSGLGVAMDPGLNSVADVSSQGVCAFEQYMTCGPATEQHATRNTTSAARSLRPRNLPPVAPNAPVSHI